MLKYLFYMVNEHHFLTLGDLRQALLNLPDTPEFNQLPLIYSHDDEGNEYQAVNWLPSLVTIEKMKSRYIQKMDPIDEDNSDEDDIDEKTSNKNNNNKDRGIPAILIN